MKILIFISEAPRRTRLFSKSILAPARIDSTRILNPPIVPNNSYPLGRPYYEIEEDFDPHDHFKIVQAPSPGGKAEVEAAVSLLQAQHVGFAHAPWRCTLLTGTESQGMSYIYWQSHHALSDGQGFMRYLFLYLASLDEHGDLKPGASADLHSLEAMQYSAGRFLAGDQAKKSGLVPAPFASAGIALAGLISGLYQMLVGLLIWFITFFYLAFFVVPKKSLRAPQKGLKQKQFAYSNKIYLDTLRDTKLALHVTINDLLVCAGTSAVQKFLESKNLLHPRERDLVILIPTSVRNPHDFSLSNSSSGYLVPFSTSPKTLMDRLHMVASRMQLYKRSWEPFVYMALWPIFLRFPWILPKVPWKNPYLSCVTATITNVPGSKVPLKWAEVPFDQQVPVVCNIPGEIGIAILSLHDHTSAGILLDLDPEADSSSPFTPGSARKLIELFESEVSSLIALAQLEKEKGGRKKSLTESLASKIPSTDSGQVFRKKLDEIEHHEEGVDVIGVGLNRRVNGGKGGK